jgi:hypothetical protein
MTFDRSKTLADSSPYLAPERLAAADTSLCRSSHKLVDSGPVSHRAD